MLKQSTLFSLRAAETFVFANGTPWQQAFWRASFGWGPVEVFLFELEPFFRDNGAWEPAFAQSNCPLEAACLGLMLLGNLNLGEDVFDIGPRAFGWIASQQGTDGLWCSHDNPGQSRRHTVALANALKHNGEHEEAVAKSVAALASDNTATFTEDPITAAHWMALTHNHRDPHVLTGHQAAYDHLTQQIQTPSITPQDAYHAHMMAKRCHLATHDPIRDSAWKSLLGAQTADGGWHDSRGTFFRVLTTLFAARSVVSR